MNSKFIQRLQEQPAEVASALTVEQLELAVVGLKDSYYNDVTLVDDDVYDAVEAVLRQRSPNSAALLVTSTPTRDGKMHLPVKMPSLNKAHDDDDELAKWLDNWSHNDNFVVSDKLDGVSALLVVVGNTPKLYTRGNGDIGRDISDMIPKLLPDLHKAAVTDTLCIVRGEIVISDEAFEQHFRNDFANPRNFVGGVVNSISNANAEHLDFVAFDFINPNRTYAEGLRFALECGFTVVKHLVVGMNDLNKAFLRGYLAERLEQADCDVDGLVIRKDSLQPLPTTENPKHSIAFKATFDDSIKTTTVVKVEWRLAKSGKLIPRVHTEPVELSGATVRRFNGVNYRYVQELMLGPGAVVRVRRSGEVIPQILSTVKPAVPASTPEVDFRIENDTHAYATDLTDNNPEIRVHRLFRFFKEIGVPYLSKRTLKRLVDAGYDTIEKIFDTEYDDLDAIPNIAAHRIRIALDVILENPVFLHDVFAGSWQFGDGFGRRTAETICTAWPSILDDIEDVSEDDVRNWLLRIPRMSFDVVDAFVDNIYDFASWVDSLPIKIHGRSEA